MDRCTWNTPELDMHCLSETLCLQVYTYFIDIDGDYTLLTSNAVVAI